MMKKLQFNIKNNNLYKKQKKTRIISKINNEIKGKKIKDKIKDRINKSYKKRTKFYKIIKKKATELYCLKHFRLNLM